MAETTCKTIAVVTALALEMRPIVAELGLVPRGSSFEGELSGTTIVAVTTGMGSSRIVATCEQLIEQRQPDLLVLGGFAGAIDPFYKSGYILSPQQVIDENGAAIRLDGDIPVELAEPSDEPLKPTLLTVRQMIANPDQKRQLRADHQAEAVDMESFHVARLAAQRELPLIVVRTINDPAEIAPASWSGRLVDDSGQERLRGALAMLITHPHRLGAMLRMRRGAKLAAQSLGVCVGGKVATWAQIQ